MVTTDRGKWSIIAECVFVYCGGRGYIDFSDRQEDLDQFTFNKCPRMSNYVCF